LCAVFVEITKEFSTLFLILRDVFFFTGLPQGSTQALAKYLNNYDAGEAIIRVVG